MVKRGRGHVRKVLGWLQRITGGLRETAGAEGYHHSLLDRYPVSVSTLVVSYVDELIADNRFTDDIHYKGGCILGNGMLSWACVMFAWNARPPHPKFFRGKSWREEWKRRLENASNSWVKDWLEHQVKQTEI